MITAEIEEFVPFGRDYLKIHPSVTPENLNVCWKLFHSFTKRIHFCKYKDGSMVRITDYRSNSLWFKSLDMTKHFHF